MSAFNSSAATGFSTKSLDSQNNSLDLKQIHKQWCVQGEASKALASGPPFLGTPLLVLRA